MLPRYANPFPIDGDQAVLPAGSELNEDAVYVPHEILRSEYHGDRTSNVVALGDLAFNSPSILGDVARRAGISCGTCHVAGASNAKLFVPGMSTRPGTFDTSGPLFNPKADNHVFDPVRIPSLRGARYLAPYGHDGRMASLRDFVRGVIVGEFAGPEPSPALLDAIVAYVQEIDFLPNPGSAPAAVSTTPRAMRSAGRGAVLKTLPARPKSELCRLPSAGGRIRRPSAARRRLGRNFQDRDLLNANFNAPYFHDGRYDSFDQVVDHFDRVYELGLSAQDRADLIAYLRAVGDARQPFDSDGVTTRFKDIGNFSLLLAQAIPARDRDAINLAVDTLGAEYRDLAEHIPDHRDAAVTGAVVERRMARAAAKETVISLRRIAMAVSVDDFDGAAAEYKTYYDLAFSKAMPLLRGTEPWSLFNPAVRAAHDAERQRLLRAPARTQAQR